MALNIPNVGVGIEPLQRGVESGTNLFSQLLGQGVNLGRMHQQGQQFNQQMGFNREQLAQQHAHHLDTFGIQKQQIDMAKKLLPHQINAMVDARKLNPMQARMLEAKMWQAIATAEDKLAFAAAIGNNDYQTGSLMSQFMGGQGINTGQMFGGNPVQQPGMTQAMPGNPMQQPMSQNVQNGAMGGPIAQPPIPTGPQGAPGQRLNIDIPYAPQSAPQEMPQTPNQELVGQKLIDPEDIKHGEKVTLFPATPGMEKRDRIAGIRGMPDKQMWSEEGVRYTQWPSGKIEAQRTGQSAQQKAETETQKKEQQETNKLNAKEYQTLKQEIPKAEELLNYVKELKQLYIKNKGREKEWWGGFYPFIPEDAQIKTRELKVNDRDFGRIKTLTGKLIAPQAQEFSTKGLKVGIDLAKDIKPGFYENYEPSLGKIEQIEKDFGIAIDREKNRMKEVAPGNKEKASNKLLDTKQGSDGKTYYKYADGWHDEKL